MLGWFCVVDAMGLWNGPVRLILRIRSEACTAEPTLGLAPTNQSQELDQRIPSIQASSQLFNSQHETRMQWDKRGDKFRVRICSVRTDPWEWVRYSYWQGSFCLRPIILYLTSSDEWQWSCSGHSDCVLGSKVRMNPSYIHSLSIASSFISQQV